MNGIIFRVLGKSVANKLTQIQLMVAFNRYFIKITMPKLIPLIIVIDQFTTTVFQMD
jgi:hypothetical protein